MSVDEPSRLQPESSVGEAAEFDEFAESYDEDLHQALRITGEDKDYFNRGRLAWLAQWLVTRKLPSASVLDYGCGTGSSTPFVLELLGADRFMGTDVSAGSLEIARQTYKQSNVEFAEIGMLDPGAFELTFCNGVFHHIPPQDRQEALAKVYRALQPGGVFAVFENNPWNPATRYVMSRCSFDRNAITLAPPETRRRMREAGFEIITTRFLFVFPAFLKRLRRLEPPLARFPFGGQYVVVARKPFQS